MGNEQIIVAVDAGHAITKALMYKYFLEEGVSNGSLSAIVSAPSVVGMGQAVSRMGTNGHHKPDEIRFEGKNFMTGNHVDQFAKKSSSRQDISRFIQGDEILVNLYRAWGALGLGLDEEATILMGAAFPITVFIDDADNRKKEKYCGGLKNRLEKTHEFLFNGERHRVKVAEAFTYLQQPTCALFDLSHNQLFQPLKEGQFNLRSGTIVVDGGGHTVDVYTQEGGEVVSKMCGVDTIGLNRSREDLKLQLENIHNVKIPLAEADRLMRCYARGELAETLVIGQPTDVTPTVEQVVSTYTSDVMDFILPLIREEASRYNIVLAGGLPYYIGNAMRDEFPPTSKGQHVYIPERPEYAVVRGMSKVLTGYYSKKAAKRGTKSR